MLKWEAARPPNLQLEVVRLRQRMGAAGKEEVVWRSGQSRSDVRTIR